jgi:hypothetical protein
MATLKQRVAARKNIRKAIAAAKRKRALAKLAVRAKVRTGMAKRRRSR